MSFGSPLFLLALLLVPLALLAQAASRRRARRYAVRFTAVPALRAAAGTTPAWRRFVPLALLLTALAALAVALAKPQRTIAVPVERASVMLVTDHSRSMMATDVKPSRLDAAKRAANLFLDKLPSGIRVGVTTFSDVPDGTLAPSRDHSDARRMINAQIADGGTATGDALAVALQALANDRQNGKRAPAAIVLLSDGATTTGRDPVEVGREARTARVPIYTVALGTADATVPNPGFGPPVLSVAPDPETLRRIAEASGGRAFTAQDDNQLSAIYKALGSQLGTRTTHREVTSAFAIGGLLLLLGAAAGSLRWSGRFP
jgi:Ca-activated chloride channel family protein